MAAVSTLAIIGLGVTAAGVAISYNQGQKAQERAQAAAQDEKQARATSAAQQATQAAAERRQQIREERVKRAQIMNAAENTGTSGSSAEMGAVGGMATQLGSNLGTNTGAILAGQQIGGFLQSAANERTSAQTYSNRAQLYGQVAGLGQSLFGQAGGWATLFGKTGKAK